MSCLKENQPHEFVDAYDEIETIPTAVINLASNCMEASNISKILSAGKLKNRKYVLSYCRNCGYRVDRIN